MCKIWNAKLLDSSFCPIIFDRLEERLWFDRVLCCIAWHGVKRSWMSWMSDKSDKSVKSCKSLLPGKKQPLCRARTATAGHTPP